MIVSVLVIGFEIVNVLSDAGGFFTFAIVISGAVFFIIAIKKFHDWYYH